MPARRAFIEINDYTLDAPLKGELEKAPEIYQPQGIDELFELTGERIYPEIQEAREKALEKLTKNEEPSTQEQVVIQEAPAVYSQAWMINGQAFAIKANNLVGIYTQIPWKGINEKGFDFEGSLKIANRYFEKEQIIFGAHSLIQIKYILEEFIDNIENFVVNNPQPSLLNGLFERRSQLNYILTEIIKLPLKHPADVQYIPCLLSNIEIDHETNKKRLSELEKILRPDNE